MKKRTRLRNGVALFSLLASAAACADELELPPLTIETQWTQIGVEDEFHHPCAGDLAAVDAYVDELRDLAGLEPAPVDVYLLTDMGDIGRFCGYDESSFLFGCFSRGRGIATFWSALRHEIGHSFAASELDFGGRAFLSEGFAEVAAGRHTAFASYPMQVSDLDLDDDELRSSVGAHRFARYLVETRGWPSYVAAMRHGDLEGVFGMSEAALVEEFEQEAPALYPGRNPCDHPVLPEVAEGEWEETMTFSCGSEGATQYEFSSWSATRDAALWRSVTLEEGRYGLEVEGGAQALIVQCQTEVLAEEPSLVSRLDVRNEADNRRQDVPLAAGVEHELEVAAGTYRVGISSGTEGQATMRVHLRRLE
ncbi:MAG: hypothetical protein ACRBN8_43880 [Nannocystales bacterium]